MRKADLFSSDGYYQRNRFLLIICGLWPEFPEWKRLAIQCITVLLILSYMVPQYSYLIRMCDNIDDLIVTAVEQTTISIGVVKYCFLTKNLKQIRITFNEMREDWHILEKLTAAETLKTCAKRAYVATKFYMFFISAIALCYGLVPLTPVILDWIVPLNESRVRYFAMKTDFSVYGINENKYYYSIMIHDAVATYMVGSCIVAVDTCILIIVEHCCGLLGAVGNILHRMQADHTPERQYKMVRHAVRVHHRAITLANSIESSFTMMYGLLVLINMVAISITGLAVIVGMGETSGLIRLIPINGGQLAALLFISLPGQEISDHSIQLSEEIYNCNWCDMSPEVRKLISFMLVRCIKPMHMTAGGFYILNLESYGNVLRTSFSFFMVMLSTR